MSTHVAYPAGMNRLATGFCMLSLMTASACDGTSDPTGGSDRRYPEHAELQSALGGEWLLTGIRGGAVPCVPKDPGGDNCPVTWEGRVWDRYEARHSTRLAFIDAQSTGDYEVDGVRIRTHAIRYRVLGTDSAWLIDGAERSLWHALPLDTVVSALAISRAERGADAPMVLLTVPLPVDGNAFMPPDSATITATGATPAVLSGQGWQMARAPASILWRGSGR